MKIILTIATVFASLFIVALIVFIASRYIGRASTKSNHGISGDVSSKRHIDNTTRLKLAAIILQAAIGNPRLMRNFTDFESFQKYLSKVAFRYADALIEMENDKENNK